MYSSKLHKNLGKQPLLLSYVIFSCSGRLSFFKAIADTVTNLWFWKAKEENKGPQFLSLQYVLSVYIIIYLFFIFRMV